MSAVTVKFVHSFVQALSKERAGGLDGSWLDAEDLREYARLLESVGFDYTLVGYQSMGPDQFVAASAVLSATTRLRAFIAIRPNAVLPTVAAQALSTLDQLSGGRVATHIISGGNDEDQRRQGDFLSKARRYDRSAEFIELLRRSWSERRPFSHRGEYFSFEGFGPGFPTLSGEPLQISFGGASEPALRVGARVADVYALWGEPLEETTQLIQRIRDLAIEQGRSNPPRFWTTFRAIVGDTDAEAWALAEEKVARTVERRNGYQARWVSEGSRRLQAVAEAGERRDRALWIPRKIAGSGGWSSLLVGSAQTIAEVIAEYARLGIELFSLPSVGDREEVSLVGTRVLPLVREIIRG